MGFYERGTAENKLEGEDDAVKELQDEIKFSSKGELNIERPLVRAESSEDFSDVQEGRVIRQSRHRQRDSADYSEGISAGSGDGGGESGDGEKSSFSLA